MGQIIYLPLPTRSDPATVTGLNRAECVLLVAIRWWVAATREAEDPLPRLRQGLVIAGVPDAVPAVDALMTVIARTARRPLVIHCPRCPAVSEDEAHLLHAVSLGQQDDPRLIERALRNALLSAQGADFALGPLEGIALLFAQANLHLRPPAPDTLH
jgi:hypothetical protein